MSNIWDDMNDGFAELHPDLAGGEIPSESVKSGLNADFSPVPESAYIRCKKCNFILNKAVHPKGWGTGISHDWSGIIDQGWGFGPWGGGWVTTVAEPNVTAGCPFCGTYNYD